MLVHHRRLLGCISSCALVLGFAAVTDADVKVPALFSDHMVLQQGMDAPVWGTADAGEDVTVSIADQKVTARADDAGKWKVRLKPVKTSEPAELTIEGKNKISIKDVIAGEVWVASGQSNMEWSAGQGSISAADVSSANYPNIRVFTVKKATKLEPTTELAGNWVVCTPQTVNSFTAVGYFFGRELHAALKVPVGIIHTSWGGTPAEAWTTREALQNNSQLAHYVPKIKEEPGKGVGPHTPSSLYNGMIAPLVPYGIKGAIWYQGESNASRGMEYRSLLPAMIESWRKAWGQGDFPFGIVQLANFTEVLPQPGDSQWAELREAQSMTAAQPNNGLAVAIDIGDAKDIHPRNKLDVGKRLSVWALAKVYGKDVPSSGPTYESHAIEGSAVKIKFANVFGGLEFKGGDALKGFAITGEDGKWVWADAKIEGDSVIVSSAQVAAPKAVRYAWANNPVCNLYNKAGLPAVPFRTDAPQSTK